MKSENCPWPAGEALRVLQSGEYIKVGSSKVEDGCQVIAATNSNLFYAVGRANSGRFYYRLNAIQI